MIRASHTVTGSIAVAVVAAGIIGTPSTPRIKHTNSFTHFVPSVSVLVPTEFFGGEVTITDTVHNDVVYTVTKPLAEYWQILLHLVKFQHFLLQELRLQIQ